MGTSLLERHLQTGIQIVLVALILWFGQSTLDVKDKVARLEEQMRGLQRDLSTATINRYTSDQATRDFEAVSSRVALIERSVESHGEWIRSVRDRLIALENDVRSYGIQKRSEVLIPSAPSPGAGRR